MYSKAKFGFVTFTFNDESLDKLRSLCTAWNSPIDDNMVVIFEFVSLIFNKGNRIH